MVQFRRSDNGMRVFIGFLIACVALLIASWIVTIWPAIPKASRDPGVAVKAYIIQSAEFTMCAAGLLCFAVEAAREARWTLLTALLVLALAFLHDIFFIATSRTTLVVIPALILIYGLRQFGWKGFFGASATGAVIAAALWTTSPYLRDRATSVLSQIESFEHENALSSAGQRIVYWTQSLRFIESAPFVGHGTGSITEMFRNAAIGHSGVWAGGSSNPHGLLLWHPARTARRHNALGNVDDPFSAIQGAGLAAWPGWSSLHKISSAHSSTPSCSISLRDGSTSAVSVWLEGSFLGSATQRAPKEITKHHRA